MPVAERSLYDKYQVEGGEEFRQVNIPLSNSFHRDIGALIMAGGGRLQGRILHNLGMGMGGYSSVDTMPTIHLRKDDKSEVPVHLWAYASHYGTPKVLEVFAKAADLEFVTETLSRELSKR